MNFPIKSFAEFTEDDYLTKDEQENVGFIRSEFLRKFMMRYFSIEDLYFKQYIQDFISYWISEVATRCVNAAFTYSGVEAANSYILGNNLLEDNELAEYMKKQIEFILKNPQNSSQQFNQEFYDGLCVCIDRYVSELNEGNRMSNICTLLSEDLKTKRQSAQIPKVTGNELNNLQEYIVKNKTDLNEQFDEHKKRIDSILKNLNDVLEQFCDYWDYANFYGCFKDELKLQMQDQKWEKLFFYIKMLQDQLEIELQNLNEFAEKNDLDENLMKNTNETIKKFSNRTPFFNLFPVRFLTSFSEEPPIKYSQAIDFINYILRATGGYTQEQFVILQRNVNQLDQQAFALLQKLLPSQALDVILACDKYNINELSRKDSKTFLCYDFWQFDIDNPNSRIIETVQKLQSKEISPMDVWLLSHGISKEVKEKIISEFPEFVEQGTQAKQKLEDTQKALKDFGIAIFPKAQKEKIRLWHEVQKANDELTASPLFALQYAKGFANEKSNRQQSFKAFIKLEQFIWYEKTIMQFFDKKSDDKRGIRDFIKTIQDNPYFLAIFEMLIKPFKAKDFIAELWNQGGEVSVIDSKYKDAAKGNILPIPDLTPFMTSPDLFPILLKVVKSDLSQEDKTNYIQFLKNIAGFPKDSPEYLGTVQFLKVQARIKSIKPLYTQNENLDRAIQNQYPIEIPPMSPEIIPEPQMQQ